MIKQTEKPRANTFVMSVLPWILGGSMLIVYLATLEHWITPNPFQPTSLNQFLDLAGWSPDGHAFTPVLFLITYPLRWLPIGIIPLALSLFAAICAALALALLARSIAILPHDRTHEQRQREQSEYSFLSIGAAWVPPLFAVVMCGLQMTFWENATRASGEMFDLLIFAYVIRCLLEYRIAQNDTWLIKFAIVFGLGMADNWAMVGFFPLFLVALVWIKGLRFFNSRFLIRTAVLGLIGFSLYFLFPVLDIFSHSGHLSAWQTIKSQVIAEKNLFKIYPREVVLLLSFTSILPVFVMGIRWASYFGDNSPLGIFLATSIFHVVHALFLVACIWVALDAPISPRNAGLGFPFLTFYYLGAIAIGYCTGYFLLIFGGRIPKYQRSLSPLLSLTNKCVTTCVAILIILSPLVLVYKNTQNLRASKIITHAYNQYFADLEKMLPSKGAVVLCDDSFRLFCLRATMLRDGDASPFLLINTKELVKDNDYVGYLKTNNPSYQLPPPSPDSAPPSSMSLIHLIENLSANHDIYYLHSSFGFFFERFYEEPHALVYRLGPYATNTWDMPLATKDQVAENQDYWKKTSADLQPIIELLNRPQHPAHPTPWDRVMTATHLSLESSTYVVPLGAYYGRELNYWGVELQRLGMTNEAGESFNNAKNLNPQNISVVVNVAFNENLRANKMRVIQLPKEMQERLSQQDVWAAILNTDGPMDEPDFRDRLAVILVAAGEYRQAVQQIRRVKQLLPKQPLAPFLLASLLGEISSKPNELTVLLPDETTRCTEMVANADEALKSITNTPVMLFVKSVGLMQLKKYDEAIQPLTTLLTIQTNNYAAQLDRAIAYYKTGNYDAAKPDYEAVGKAAPKAYQVYYGLAEIAYHQNDIPEAIKNYQLYLTNAPAHTEEAASVVARLKELENSSH